MLEPGPFPQSCILRESWRRGQIRGDAKRRTEVVKRTAMIGAAQVRMIFQIAYSEELMVTRAALLQQCGYKVRSALGNKNAKQALVSPAEYRLFIIGHAAETEVRQDMVRWLRQRYPHAKILALDPPYASGDCGADYRVVLDGPEEWLAFVLQNFPRTQAHRG